MTHSSCSLWLHKILPVPRHRPPLGAFMTATMTALQKKDGGVRGIATGTSFRRLVAKSLARQFSDEVESACSPFQFALSTRAGKDCVGHAIRAATDANFLCTVLSIDGVGAYDHVFRSSMMCKIWEVPGLRSLLPFMRSVYQHPSQYIWEDSEGRRHVIEQHEGGEQGDPLMPLLLSLAIHNALVEVQANLRDDEHLFAFLDDVYVLTSPERVRDVFNLLSEKLFNLAGIQLHSGKTRTWNQAGVIPPNMQDVGEDVWSPNGVKVLGTPIGGEDFVRQASDSRLDEESRLWEAVSWVPDVQCGWQTLVHCAGPRCHHLLRTVPPSQSRQCAVGHDAGMMRAMESVLGGIPGDGQQQETAHRFASLPMRLGGLGIRSAARMAPGAYWASWADALPMISGRLPGLADSIVENLVSGLVDRGCLAELQSAADSLTRSGFVAQPGWRALGHMSLASGSMAGSITRRLLSSTTSGRP